MDFCDITPNTVFKKTDEENDLRGCSQELCQCDLYVEIVKNFKPLHFGTFNPDYVRPMYRADGTKCGCNEYSIAGMYNKEPRKGDFGPFDSGQHVKLPPHSIFRKINEHTGISYPVCAPQEPIGRGIIGYESHKKLLLEHHRLNKIYMQPTDLQLCRKK